MKQRKRFIQKFKPIWCEMGGVDHRHRRVGLFRNVQLFIGWTFWKVTPTIHVTFTVFQEVALFQEVQVSVGSWVKDTQNNVFLHTEVRFVHVSDSMRYQFIQNISNQLIFPKREILFCNTFTVRLATPSIKTLHKKHGKIIFPNGSGSLSCFRCYWVVSFSIKKKWF